MLILLVISVIGFDDNICDLFLMDERILIYYVNGISIDWVNKNDVVEYLVLGFCLLCGLE